MIVYSLLLVCGFLAIWFLRMVRAPLYKLAENTLATLDTILSSEDDEAKLQSLQKNTRRLLFSLVLASICFALAAALAYAPIWLNQYFLWVKPDGVSLLYWMLALSVGASIPFFVPLPKKASGYSEPAQLLHRLILNHYHLGLKMLRWEVKRIQPPTKEQTPFIIVSGLARAGTTSLMNHLTSLPQFASLSYAQMPFLLSPNTWQKWYKPTAKKAKERSHQDGIKINYQSSEALEEYFFKALLNDAYISETKVDEHAINDHQRKLYAQYQRLIAKPGQVYLAKNNNYLLRYASMRKAFPNFVLSLLFRHPLYHAASLLAMHNRYLKLQKQDPFVLEYMNWLGHYEFGENHKWFAFAGSNPPANQVKSLDYWLHVWINYYQRALELKHDCTVFKNYDELCQKPRKVVQAVGDTLGLHLETSLLSPYSNPRQVTEPCEPNLLNQALAIYEQLQKRSILCR